MEITKNGSCISLQTEFLCIIQLQKDKRFWYKNTWMTHTLT